MSPEQITTPQEVDERTDIWSLGITLYRLLTGAVPFEGDSMSEVYAHVLNTEPKPIYAVRRGLDSELDSIVRRCLEKNPGRRYQNVLELSRELARYRRRHRRDSSMVTTGSSPAGYVDDSPVQLPLRGPKWRTLAALFLTALAAFALYEADRTGRIDGRAIAGKALGPVLALDGVRRFKEEWMPRLGELPEQPTDRRGRIPPLQLPSGVCAISAAFDSSGRTIASEPEHEEEDVSVEPGAGDD